MLKPLFPHPALLLVKDKKYLIISDLHIGFEEKYEGAGIRVRSSTDAMMKVLSQLLEEHRPDHLIILGDVKDSIDRIGRAEWREVPSFLENITSKVKVSVVAGNHDGGILPLLPKDVRLLEGPVVLMGDDALLHGHTGLPARAASAKRIIMGHIHPKYGRKGSSLSGKPVWLRLKVKRSHIFDEEKEGDLEVYVLPAFNKELAWYTSMRRKIVSPILRRAKDGIVDGWVITLEGDIVGGLESLQYVL
ncbi:MAG: metallophosphoesterase [Nitrososphaerota archaeon]